MIEFIKKWIVLPIAFAAGYIFFFISKRGQETAKTRLKDRLLDLQDEKERQRGVANEAAKNWDDRRDSYVNTPGDGK